MKNNKNNDTETIEQNVTEAETMNAMIDAPMGEPKSAAEILKQIENNELPRVKSRDILGREFDVTDATLTQIKNTKTDKLEDCVNFEIVLKDTGEVLSTTKALNFYTQPYLDYFKAPGATKLESRMFVELLDRPEVAGNHPITIRAYDSAYGKSLAKD